jgi:hypothetical protein
MLSGVDEGTVPESPWLLPGQNSLQRFQNAGFEFAWIISDFLTEVLS